MGGDAAMTWADFVAGWDAIFREPVIAGTVGGAVLGFLGMYVVLRRMVFVSAAVTSAAAMGVALAFYVEIHHAMHVDPLYMAVGLSLATMALFIGDGARMRLSRESLLGLTYAVTGGLTLLIESRISQEAHDIHSILFGDAVLVRDLDYYAILGAGGVALALHVWWFRGVTFAAFDTATARVQGLPVRALNGFVLLTIGVMVGVAARALGALPVFAFTTLPAIAALVIGVRLPWAFALATAFGALAGGGGYLVATFRDLPVGGSQTVTAGALALAAMAGYGAVSAVRRGLRRRGGREPR
ncbi:MAG: metal ABC transporter permease [Deltaproteobacteria bacterium]|nr:MAG: metal ABC transporter permease [Deltaproteobacteria bacterium]